MESPPKATDVEVEDTTPWPTQYLRAAVGPAGADAGTAARHGVDGCVRRDSRRHTMAGRAVAVGRT